MKKVLLCLLSVLLMLPIVMRAQTTDITVGTGTSSDYYAPFGNYYEDSWDESIYPASAINAAGTITEIAYNCASASSLTFNTLKIYMGTKSTTSHYDETDWLPMSDLTLVYQGYNITVGSSTGWQSFQLDEPFFYDGQDNLVIVVAKDQSGYSNSQTWYYTSSTGATLHIQADGDISYMQHPGSEYGDMYNYYPNVKLTMSVVPITCPGPSGLAISNVNDNSADFTWTAGGTESSWDIYLATSSTDIPDDNSNPTYTSTSTSYSFSGLSSSTDYYVYVRANCGAGDVSRWKNVRFMTSQIAAQMPYTCDFEDASENANWTLIGVNTNKWVFGTAVNATDNGQSALYISNDNGATNNYSHTTSTAWAYRDIEFDNSYAEYHISFDFKGVGESAYYDNLRVYIGAPANPPAASSSSGACPQGAVEIGNFHNEASWIHPEIVLNSSFTGVQRLYFLWWNDTGGGNPPAAAVDNLEVTGVNCGTPYNLALDTTTQTSVAFTFHPASPNDYSWQVILMNHGDSIDESQAITISDTAYEFTDLTPNTAYQIYVRTDCGSETSWWSSALNVRTDCPEYITIPFTENFDNYGGSGSTSYFPSCWTRMSTYNTSYPYISSTNYSAPGSLYFYGSSSSSYTMVALPEVDPSFPINTLTISFMDYASGTTSSYAMQVGVLDGTTFTPVASVYPNAANTWCEQEIDFSSYTGNGQTIAFKFAPSSSYSHYIDNVSLYVTPTCLKPVSVSVSNVTDNSADVSWMARSGESSWTVVAVPHGDDPATGTEEYAYSNPYTVTNLTDNTQYDVYVKANCDNGESSVWSVVTSFTTKCLPTNVIPYIEDFNTYGMGSSSYFPNCWTRHQIGTTSIYPYISSTGGGSLYFYSSTSGISTYGASQALDLSNETPGSLSLSFDIYKSSSSYGRMNVGYMTDADDINTFHLIKSFYPGDFDASSTWYNQTVVLPDAAYLPNVYLAFVAPAGASNYVYIDNIVVDYAQNICQAPSNVSISNIMGGSALVNWVASADQNDFVVEYSEHNMDNWTSVQATGSNVMLSGLSELTQYDVMVYASCASSYSDTVTATFTTKCNAGGEVTIGTGTTTEYYYPVNNYYKYSYTQQIYTAAEMNGPTTINGVSFEYSYSSSSSKSNVNIYMGHTTQSSFSSTSNYIPATNLQLVYSGNLNCHQGWNDFAFTTPFQYNGTDNLVIAVDDNTGSYSGNSYTFYASAAGATRTLYYYSDSYNPDPSNPTSSGASSSTASNRVNIKFQANCDSSATCFRPNMYVESYDDQSITVAWVAGGYENSWELRYHSASDASNWITETVTASPFVITNLDASETYTIQMRSDCGGEYSDWIGTEVTTACEYVVNLPYTEDFESAAGSGAAYFVNCWTRGTNSSTQYPYCSTSYNTTASGSKSLYFYGSSSNYCYAATPRFDDSIEMDNLQIQFMGKATSSGYFLEVGIMTNPNDYNTFVPVGTFTTSSTSFEAGEINTNGYSGNGHYVAFRIPQWASSYIYLDDVHINYIPECPHINNLHTTAVAEDEFTVAWNAGDQETEWEVIVAETTPNMNPDDYSSESVYATTYTATNLMAATYYTVFVRANCDNGESSEWTSLMVKTAQNPAALPYFCDFENNQENNNWVIVNSTVVNEWHIGTATNNGGSHAMYISNDNGVSNNYTNTSACVVWAYRDIYFPACPGGYRMSFDWRCTGESSYDYMKVYWGNPETPTPSTSSTITVPAGATVIPNSSSTEYYNQQSSYVTKTIDLPALTTSGVKRIYFCWRQDGSAGSTPPAAVDNISINAIYCDSPTNLTVDNVSAYSADISWTDAVSSDWTIEYAAEGDATWIVDDMASNPYTLTNLQPSTNYTVRVAANCGDGNISPYVFATFKTSCVALTQVPFEEDFESYPGGSSSNNVLPDCWSMLNTGTSSVGCPTVYSSSTYASSGSNVLYFYASSSTSYADQYAILPPVDPTVLPLQGLRLSFKARRYSTTTTYVNTIIVGVMSNPTDASSFVPVDTVVLQNTTIESHHVDFNNYVGNGAYVAIMVPRPSGSFSSGYNYIDDVKLDIAPSCGNPTDFTATLTSSSDVTLSWNDEPGESTWELLLVPASATADFSQAQTLNTNSYSESGLAGNTAYQAYIRTQCSNGLGYSEWISTTFSTPSDNPAQLPYYNGFEDGAENAEWVIRNTTTANKWYIGKPSGQADSVLYISKDNGATNSYDGDNANVVWAYRDIQLPVAAEYQIRLKWKCYGESSYDYMYAYIGNPADVTASTSSTIVAPANAIQLGGTEYRFNQNSTWSWFTESINSSIGSGVKRLYFAWKNDGSVENQPPIMIDSIEIIASNCGSPYDLAVSAVSTTTADVAFSPAAPTDNAWEYVISTTATFNPDMETPDMLTYNSFNISGLTANTTYYVYVRTLCDDGSYSNWSSMLTFTTACDEITTIPYTENFDTYGTGESAYPNCWSKINTYSANRPYVNSTNYAGVGSLYFYAGTSGTYNIAVMPPFDASIAINTLQASFKLRGSNSSDRLIVGVMSNPMDASTFVPVDTVPVGTNYSSWIDREVLFSNYTGNGQYIAFKNEYTTTYAYAYIDNLTIDLIPSCPKPRNLTVTNATTSSIDLSWTEMGSASTWNIEYGPAGFTQGQGTVVTAYTNPYTVTGLDASTNYDFYVQADCGGSDASPWTDVLHGATDCGAVSLPYIENFESYAGTTYSTPGPTPTCWTTWTNNTTYPAPHVTSSGTGCYPSSGTNALTFIASSSSDGVTTGASALAILPTFTDDLNTLKLTFSYRMESSTSGELRVGYVTNPNSPLATFTQVAIIPSTTTVTTDSIDFSTVTGVPANGNIAFYWYKESTWYTCSVDDINVTLSGSTPPVVTCDAPTALAASNVAQTSATINWQAGGSETAWNLQYKAASAANWSNSITVNNTPTYNLTGLTANTAYQVRVQATCGAGQTSAWTTASFTTLSENPQDCPAPTNFRADAITQNSVTLAWNQAAGTATEWEINYKAADAATWTNITVAANPYTITDLTPETAYQAQILAHCANGVNSDATEIITFTTLPDGINNYVLDNSTSLYPNPTTGLLTISNEQCAMNTVDVYDVYGKLLMSVEVNGNVATIDATSLSAGVYFAKVETEKGVVTKRFVKK